MKMRQKVFILFSIVMSLYLLGCAPQMSSATEAQEAAAQVPR